MRRVCAVRNYEMPSILTKAICISGDFLWRIAYLRVYLIPIRGKPFFIYTRIKFFGDGSTKEHCTASAQANLLVRNRVCFTQRNTLYRRRRKSGILIRSQRSTINLMEENRAQRKLHLLD